MAHPYYEMHPVWNEAWASFASVSTKDSFCPSTLCRVDNDRDPFLPLHRVPLPILCPEPKASDDPEQAKLNVEAAERSVVWNLGWFADPVYFGDYVRARFLVVAKLPTKLHCERPSRQRPRQLRSFRCYVFSAESRATTDFIRY